MPWNVALIYLKVYIYIYKKLIFQCLQRTYLCWLHAGWDQIGKQPQNRDKDGSFFQRLPRCGTLNKSWFNLWDSAMFMHLTPSHFQ